jgi:SAM-dependent methyltransferase
MGIFRPIRNLLFWPRQRLHLRRNARLHLAYRYLSGDGIEIGAMHFPSPVHRGMHVKYVDNTSLEDSIAKFPELQGQNLVRPDYIEDGFELASFQPESQNFVIANHVLEHSPNPFRALSNWVRVLRPGGCLLVSVPLAAKCFDSGRIETSLEHLLQDFQSNPEQLASRNLEHYLEWLTVSEPAILLASNPNFRMGSAIEIQRRAEELCRSQAEIHFHTFSTASFENILRHFAAISPAGLNLLCVMETGGEVAAVLKRGK